MRYMMIVQYDGKNYFGFQKQKNHPSIQEELEKAIEILTKEKVNCVASGRTDAKVSAYHQPVHFEIDDDGLYSPSFIGSMNAILPKDIRILSLTKTKLHARFSAKRKTYLYKMYISNYEKPLFSNALFLRKTDFMGNQNYNLKLMKKFCKLIIGTHDFIGFRASGGKNDTTIRTIYSAKIKKEKDYLNFYVTGNGFLYKMVRNLVGTMLEIAKGKLNFKELKKTIFKNFKSTNTAKPEFLYLYNVKYN